MRGLAVAREELSEQLNSVELGSLLTENNRPPGVSLHLELSSVCHLLEGSHVTTYVTIFFHNAFFYFVLPQKLERVGPVDNRPSTN